MRPPSPEADVQAQVGFGNDVRRTGEHFGKVELIIPSGAELTGMGKRKKRGGLALLGRGKEVTIKGSRSLYFRPLLHLHIELLPGTAPCGPAPISPIAMGVEPIGIGGCKRCRGAEVVSDDGPDAAIMPVLLQQFLCETEKGGVRDNVVLKNNAFLFLCEEPRDVGHHPGPAP